MTTTKPTGGRVSLAEFERIFESVKNWGRWGPDDQLGTLNLITPERVAAAAGLVRSGRRVSLEIPINTVAGPDNPNQAIHLVTQGHDIDIGSGGLRFGLDFLAMACHGDCHSHVDALCHISYNGQTYNGKPALEVLRGAGFFLFLQSPPITPFRFRFAPPREGENGLSGVVKTQHSQKNCWSIRGCLAIIPLVSSGLKKGIQKPRCTPYASPCFSQYFKTTWGFQE